MSNNELTAKVTELKELKIMQDELQAEIASIENEIKSYMDDRALEELNCGIFKVLYKTVKSTRFDAKALKTANLGLYEQFIKTTEYKRFQIA